MDLFMHEAICFITGIMVGGFFGVVTMCLVQINSLYDKEDAE